MLSKYAIDLQGFTDNLKLLSRKDFLSGMSNSKYWYFHQNQRVNGLACKSALLQVWWSSENRQWHVLPSTAHVD